VTWVIVGLIFTSVVIAGWRRKVPRYQVFVAAALLGGFLVIEREARETGSVYGIPVTSCVLGFRCSPLPTPDTTADCD
jgi:hypothetical protein